MVEWSIDNPETSQEPYWNNRTIKRWTSFGVAAQHSSCWPRNFLNMLKPSKSDWQESFKHKIGRNSIVLGHFKCSESWPLRILRETVAYFPSLIAIWLTFSISFCNGLDVARILWNWTCIRRSFRYIEMCKIRKINSYWKVILRRDVGESFC